MVAQIKEKHFNIEYRIYFKTQHDKIIQTPHLYKHFMQVDWLKLKFCTSIMSRAGIGRIYFSSASSKYWHIFDDKEWIIIFVDFIAV